jgi:hypothetical protein
VVKMVLWTEGPFGPSDVRRREAVIPAPADWVAEVHPRRFLALPDETVRVLSPPGWGQPRGSNGCFGRNRFGRLQRATGRRRGRPRHRALSSASTHCGMSVHRRSRQQPMRPLHPGAVPTRAPRPSTARVPGQIYHSGPRKRPLIGSSCPSLVTFDQTAERFQ